MKPAFLIAGGNQPARASRRPAAFIVEIEMHPEFAGLFCNGRIYLQKFRSKIIRFHPGAETPGAERFRERMRAHVPQTVRSHILKLRAEFCRFKLVVPHPEKARAVERVVIGGDDGRRDNRN